MFFADGNADRTKENCPCSACTVEREHPEAMIPLHVILRAMQMMGRAGFPVPVDEEGTMGFAPLISSPEMAYSILLGILHDFRKETGFTTEMATTIMATIGMDDDQIDQLQLAFLDSEVESGDASIDWDAMLTGGNE